MRRTTLCLAVLAIMGCDDKPTQAVPSAQPAAPKEGLRIDEQHTEARSLLAIGTQGEQSWRITVATDALSCDALKEAYPQRPPKAPGTRVDFWLRRPMNPDGSADVWSVRSAFITDAAGGRGMVTRGGMLEALAESPETVRVVGLDLACSDGDKQVAFTGGIMAKNCGRVALAAAPELADLRVSVAGSRYPIHGATVRPIGKRFHLRLSRAPHTCDSDFAEGFDSYVDVALEGTPPTLAFASLLGDAFPDSPSGSKGKETFRVTAPETLAGTTPIDIELDGKLDLTGYAFAIRGKATALRCPPPASTKAKAK